MYPKSTKKEDIYFFAKLLEICEYEKGYPIDTFKIIPLIETTGAVINIQDICNVPRVIAVAFGSEDFVTDLNGMYDLERQNVFTTRAMIAMAARAAGIIPIDTIHVKVHDMEDLERHLSIGKRLDFEGMLSLNPKELPLIHAYYSPTEEEIKWAEEILDFVQGNVSSEKVVAVKGNKIIGLPMVKRARKILDKKAQIQKHV